MRIITTNKGEWGIMTVPCEKDKQLINRACYLKVNTHNGFPIHMDFSLRMSDEAIRIVIDKAVVRVPTLRGEYAVETRTDENDGSVYHVATRIASPDEQILFKGYCTLHDIVQHIESIHAHTNVL